MKNKSHAFWMLLLLVVIFSCKTTEPVVTEEPAPVVEAQPEPEPDPVVVEEPVIEDVIVNDETGFQVSLELYEMTFNEMKDLIGKLNEIISDRNYEKWKLYLSENYIRIYNDKAMLKQISEQSQILADNGIVLETLKDYFEWVVVPSRSKASLDDLMFIDDTHLTAYMLIKEKRTILYELEKIDDKWLISVW